MAKHFTPAMAVQAIEDMIPPHVVSGKLKVWIYYRAEKSKGMLKAQWGLGIGGDWQMKCEDNLRQAYGNRILGVEVVEEEVEVIEEGEE